jgi:hypothetical protein
LQLFIAPDILYSIEVEWRLNLRDIECKPIKEQTESESEERLGQCNDAPVRGG